MDQLPALPLKEDIISSYVDCTSIVGLKFHVLSSGTNDASKPLLLFCHGFPELAYSWRHVLPYFGSKGYYAVAFDQRGYGRTTGWDKRSYANIDIQSFGAVQNTIDVLALVTELGRKRVDCIIGHDVGAATAAGCALMRPDIFRACVLMSHPFDGAPPLRSSTEEKSSKLTSKTAQFDPDIEGSLAMIGLKHYARSNSSALAADQWENPRQGMTEFLRGYFFLKSASDTRNAPHPLTSWTADELAKMPHYYIQKLDLSMAETVAEDVQGQNVESTKSWLSEKDLAIYVGEWERTGFRAALSWYRNRTMPGAGQDMLVFAGKKIDVPTCFISGKQDWGNHQRPGALQGMGKTCTDFHGVRFVEGAGHWPQQEKPDNVIKEIENFINELHKSK